LARDKRAAPAPARAVAARLLARVVDERRSLSDVLPAALKEIPDPRQRALVQELSYGTLRWFYRLDALLALLLQKPLKRRDGDLRCLLLAGLYQLTQLATPPHVAVHETVQAVRDLDKAWAAGLVNAVLRSWQRQQDQLQAALENDPVARYAHPGWLLECFQRDWPEDWLEMIRVNNSRPPFSLRVNRQRGTREAYLEQLQRQGLSATALAHAAEGILLAEPVPVDRLPGFAAGQVSVQDGAAQLVAGLLALAPGQRVLDACAAPGGKTAHILESEPALETLTAIDIDARRLSRVQENLSRLGLAAEVIAGDAAEPGAWWDGQAYDRVLLDAPCSASGVIRRHPDIKILRRPTDIAPLAARQQELLGAMWPLLTAGGMLLYTTCSVLSEENHRQMERFLATHPDAAEVPIDASWGRRCVYGRQLLPGDYNMDGFYFACLKKAGN